MSTATRTVLIAMDSTIKSDNAFKWYKDNIHRQSDYVFLVYNADHGSIVTAPVPFAKPGTACRLIREEDEIEDLMSQLKIKLQTADINGTVIRGSGITPGEEIVKISRERKADMIIIGKHHHGKIRRVLMGCVSQYLIHHSHIPVLVVKK